MKIPYFLFYDNMAAEEWIKLFYKDFSSSIMLVFLKGMKNSHLGSGLIQCIVNE